MQAALTESARTLLGDLETGVRIGSTGLPPDWRPAGLAEEQDVAAGTSWQDGDTWTGPATVDRLVVAQLLVRDAAGQSLPYGAPALLELNASRAAGLAGDLRP